MGKGISLKRGVGLDYMVWNVGFEGMRMDQYDEMEEGGGRGFGLSIPG